MPITVLPGHTFTMRALLDNDEWGPPEVWTVGAVEIGGDDPQFWATAPGGQYGRWPVSMWADLKRLSPDAKGEKGSE